MTVYPVKQLRGFTSLADAAHSGMWVYLQNTYLPRPNIHGKSPPIRMRVGGLLPRGTFQLSQSALMVVQDRN